MIKPEIQEFFEDEWSFVDDPKIHDQEVSDIFWNAVDALDYEDFLAEQTFKLLIKRLPYFIDSYNHLSIAFKNQKKDFESFLTAEKSYNIGMSAFPKNFKIGRDKLPWSILENRPFLRACQILGLEYQDKKDYKKAIELYSKILKLNENDNQGIRYLILECFFNLKDLKSARKFIDKYSDDWSLEFLYGKIAIAIIEGNKEKALEILPDAQKRNPFLSDEIIKARHIAPPPHRIPGEPNFDAGIPVGSIQESFAYWSRNKTLYKRKEIINFYKETK